MNKPCDLPLSEDMTAKEYSFLVNKGIWADYLLPLGEGCTRTIYDGQLQQNETTESGVIIPTFTEVTISLPKQKSSDESPCVTINRSKGIDLDLREAEALENLTHPNLPEILFSCVPDRRRINVIKTPIGNSLEEKIKKSGKLKSCRKTDNLISQMLSVVEYIHNQGKLHRDIKPSNMVINEEDYDTKRGEYRKLMLKLIDHQNSSRTSLEDSCITTRGGTAYTHRSLLNNLATGEPAKATEKTDLYSLGGTFYFMLSGENPSDYKFVRDEDGRKIQIGNKTIRVSLVRKNNAGRILERKAEIQDSEEEARIKNMCKKVPRMYREFVYRCMTDNTEGFGTVREAREYFERLSSSNYKILVDKAVDRIRRTAKTMLPLAAAAGIVLSLAPALNYVDIRSNYAEARIKNDSRSIIFSEYAQSIKDKSPVERAQLMFDFSEKNKPISGEEQR